MYQLVHSKDLIFNINGLIYFKNQVFTGILYEELEENNIFRDDLLIDLTIIKDGKRIKQYIPPCFPVHLFNMNNIKYMWINDEYGQHTFPENFNHPEFTGILYQGDTADYPMPQWTPPPPLGSAEEYEKWHKLYKDKEDINYPLTTDDLAWSGGIFFAVINGQRKLNDKIIYEHDNLSGSNLRCIVEGEHIKLPENMLMFDVDESTL